MDPMDAVTALLSPEGAGDPYPLYEALRPYGPVVSLGETLHLVVGYEAVDAALRDPALGVPDAAGMDGRWPEWRHNRAVSLFVTSMLRSNPPAHTRMRRLAAGVFTARRVGRLRDTVAGQVAELVDALPPEADVMEELAYPLPVAVICALLGVPASDRARFRRLAVDLTAVLELVVSQDQAERAHAAGKEVAAYLADLAARRRAEPGDDLVSALTQAYDAGGDRLTGDELLGNLMLLLVAGFETTANLLGNGTAVLLDRPELARRLADDEAFAEPFVEEVLRWDAPVQLTDRIPLRDTVVAGVPVRAGSQVVLLLGAANRDPARFAGPAAFDPARAQNTPITFGAGAHYCLGAPLARLEAQLALPALARRRPRRAGPAARRSRLTLRGYASLPVTVTP
ncbi:cytochrome P450 [Spirilliplanes yamanashiensis]|uniref:Cytochrome P450 n=1 Tax=Spirilliplanes yamanashiensis TaxID=42233 RepID=A0A8J4DKA0_9ACTN|nr:cytochrome P450 [Spirilliplanes yamanashiensis]MDP9818596.1 cytochrome P450 [Spirilliplanes yamanashiensis]GIJ05052.1 cytochrome P450 [Spirilliplanes yamanashiensis]